MPITRTLGTDDDGSGTTGTVVNTAWKTEFYNQIDAALAGVSGVVQTTALAGTQNDFALTAGAGALRCSNATLLSISGLAAGYDGQRLTITAVGTGQVDLLDQNGASAAANRIINGVTGPRSLSPGSGSATLEYNAAMSRWRVIAHEQGAWITPPFNAANFTAPPGTWTVDAGDVAQCRYRLSGRTLTIALNLQSTSVVGAGITDLNIGNGAYGGFTWSDSFWNPMASLYDGGTYTAGAYFYAFTSKIIAQKLSGAFASSTNLTHMRGVITGEVM